MACRRGVGGQPQLGRPAQDAAGEPRLTAAQTPMDNPGCGCEVTRVRSRLQALIRALKGTRLWPENQPPGPGGVGGVSPRNSQSGHQLIQNNLGGMLSLSLRGRIEVTSMFPGTQSQDTSPCKNSRGGMLSLGPGVAQGTRGTRAARPVFRQPRAKLSRRRDCHFAAPPSAFSRRFNRDGERASAE